MLRPIVCGLLLAGFGGAARAGELDRETGPAPASPAKSEVVPVVAGSELDTESPQQSHYWRRGWSGPAFGWGGSGFGWGGPGFGWGGFAPARVSFGWGWGGYPAFSPWRFNYPSFYSHRTFGFGGFGGYGGFGYRSFYPAYYPVGWGWGGGWGW